MLIGYARCSTDAQDLTFAGVLRTKRSAHAAGSFDQDPALALAREREPPGVHAKAEVAQAGGHRNGQHGLLVQSQTSSSRAEHSVEIHASASR